MILDFVVHARDLDPPRGPDLSQPGRISQKRALADEASFCGGTAATVQFQFQCDGLVFQECENASAEGGGVVRDGAFSRVYCRFAKQSTCNAHESVRPPSIANT